MKQLAVLGVTLAACGGGAGDNPSAFSEAAEAVVGIYRLDSYTRNEAACTPDGVSVAGQDTFAVAQYGQIAPGFETLNILSCASPQDCRAKLADSDGFTIDFSFSVQFLGDNGELTGGGGSTGFGDGETCTLGSVFDTVLTLTGDQLRVEQAITVADDFAVDGNGFCTTDNARDAAEGNTCSQMEVLTATFVEAL